MISGLGQVYLKNLVPFCICINNDDHINNLKIPKLNYSKLRNQVGENGGLLQIKLVRTSNNPIGMMVFPIKIYH